MTAATNAAAQIKILQCTVITGRVESIPSRCVSVLSQYAIEVREGFARVGSNPDRRRNRRSSGLGMSKIIAMRALSDSIMMAVMMRPFAVTTRPAAPLISLSWTCAFETSPQRPAVRMRLSERSGVLCAERAHGWVRLRFASIRLKGLHAAQSDHGLRQ